MAGTRELPFRVEPKGINPKLVQEQIENVRREFETKLTERENKYKEEIGSVSKERDSIKKMLDDIKSKQKESNIFCPTCVTKDEHGHEHKHEMKPIGNDTYQCVGPECGSKKVLVDLESDYECDNCGFPHKRTTKEEHTSSICPGCGQSTHMTKKDYKFAKLAKALRKDKNKK